MKPYRIVAETDTEITYEYRTAYTWALYVLLIAMIVGVSIPNDLLAVAAGAAAIVYFVLKLVLGKGATDHIRKAMRVGTVQISGNRTSFSNPLRIRVPK